MAYYNWQNIFKNKTEDELIRIYSGDSLLDYEAGIFAGLELKNRGYDFRKIEKIHAEKIEELKRDIEEYKDLQFRNSKYFRNQISGGIGFVIMLIFLIRNYSMLRSDQNYKYIEVIYFLGLSLLGFIFAKWNFKRFKRNKERTLTEKARLLLKITSND